MPVALKLAISRGWKASENDRFGDALEVRFYDPRTMKVMFVYAPKLEDKEFFSKMWELLIRFDDAHKQAINVVREVDPTFNLSGGCGVKNPDEVKR